MKRASQSVENLKKATKQALRHVNTGLSVLRVALAINRNTFNPLTKSWSEKRPPIGKSFRIRLVARLSLQYMATIPTWMGCR